MEYREKIYCRRRSQGLGKLKYMGSRYSVLSHLSEVPIRVWKLSRSPCTEASNNFWQDRYFRLYQNSCIRCSERRVELEPKRGQSHVDGTHGATEQGHHGCLSPSQVFSRRVLQGETPSRSPGGQWTALGWASFVYFYQSERISIVYKFQNFILE